MISPAEKFSELKHVLLDLDKPSEYFEKIRTDEKLRVWYPQLAALIGVNQNQNYHMEGDVWTHTMMVLDQAAIRRDKVSNPFGFMLSALCHDFGKAVTTEETDGVFHSYGHEDAGVPLAEEFLISFSAPAELVSYVKNMVRLHMEPNMMANAKSKIKKTNRMFFESGSPYDLVQLAVCDGLGKIPGSDESESFLTERLKIFREIISRPYVTREDIEKSGEVSRENTDLVFEHAQKLRLAGVKKENAMIQTIAFARKLRETEKNEH